MWKDGLSRVAFIQNNERFKDTHIEKAHSNKTPALTEGINMDI